MDILAEKLNTKLHSWKPDIAKQVRQYVKELIDLAVKASNRCDAFQKCRTRSIGYAR
jgi:hypothetical protein